MVGPTAKRRVVGFLSKDLVCSQRRACNLVGFSRGTYRRHPMRTESDSYLRKLLHNLAMKHPRYGYRRNPRFV